MYFSKYQAETNLLVSRIVAGGDEAEDLQLHLERMVDATRETARGGPKAAVLVIFDKGHEVPTPLLRKRIAEITGRRDFVLHLAIVTESRLLRGVLTALSWLRRAHFDTTVEPTAHKAIRWLEEMRGEPLPGLMPMLSAVNAQMVEATQKRAGDGARRLSR